MQTTIEVPAPKGDIRERGAEPAPGLLCVANFPSNTGYAWNFIEGLYAGISDRLAASGVATWVAYPEIAEPPAPLAGSAARATEMEIDLDSRYSVLNLLRFIRTNRIQALYLTDRASWHPAYLLLRMAGVRKIVVHDHTSGARTRPRGAKRMMKLLTRRLPGMLADEVIGVSDFVARRKVEVDLVPAKRVRRIWNSLEIPPRSPGAARQLRATFGLPAERPVVVCACRATPEKGVVHLLRAFERVCSPDDPRRPALVYMGSGPALDEILAVRDSLACRGDIFCPGYRDDAADLVAGADLCVVPSVWEEAFGLAVLEPMARGVPVIASRAGGIPEVVEDGETGLLVPPGDEDAIARAMRRLIENPEERRRMGANGRLRAEQHFALENEIDELTQLLRGGFPSQSAPLE
jgi:glycosyltransferase involved in cell wall biosynthesis